MSQDGSGESIPFLGAATSASDDARALSPADQYAHPLPSIDAAPAESTDAALGTPATPQTNPQIYAWPTQPAPSYLAIAKSDSRYALNHSVPQAIQNAVPNPAPNAARYPTAPHHAGFDYSHELQASQTAGYVPLPAALTQVTPYAASRGLALPTTTPATLWSLTPSNTADFRPPTSTAEPVEAPTLGASTSYPKATASRRSTRTGRTPLSRTAVTAVLFALIGAVPLAIIAAVLAVHDVRRDGRGRTALLATTLLSGLWLLAAGVFAAQVTDEGDEPSAAQQRIIPAYAATPGTCFSAAPDPQSGLVQRVGCADVEALFEAVGTFRLPTLSEPGLISAADSPNDSAATEASVTVEATGGDVCARFQTPRPSVPWFPTVQQQALGARQGICVATALPAAAIEQPSVTDPAEEPTQP